MIRIDFNKLEITGPRPIVEAEFTALLKNCKRVLGEETYDRCLKNSELTDEQIRKQSDAGLKSFVKTVLEMMEEDE